MTRSDAVRLETRVRFDAGFLRRLGLLAARPPGSGRAPGGTLRGAVRGHELEALRPWRPGDDPRLLEWAATLRSGEPVVRRVRGETAPRLQLVLDASLSMAVGAPSKLQRAAELAAWLGVRALSAGGRVRLVVRGGAAAVREFGGRDRVAELLAALQAVEARGAADARALAAGVPARGDAWVFGDYASLEPAPLCEARPRGGLRAVLLVAAEERAPGAAPAVRWQDPETPRSSAARVDAQLVARYLRELSNELDKRAALLRAARGELLVLAAEGPFEEQVQRLRAAAEAP